MYSHSPEEEKELKKRIHEKKYSPFHTNFLDENGNPTDGSVRQIIFGGEELKEKSIAKKFYQPYHNFGRSLSSVKRLFELYPIFYELYEKDNVEKFMELLEINSTEDIDDALDKALGKTEWTGESFTTDLGKLRTIAALRESKDAFESAKKTGKYRNSNVPMTPLLGLMKESTTDMFNLYDEPEFLNEMILVYLVTLFKEYLKSTLKELNDVCPNLIIDLQTKKSIELIPDDYLKVLKIFKNNLNFNLEKKIPKWKLIREKFDRRNILIHYNGKPTPEYIKEYKNKDEPKLKTDTKYVNDSIELFKIIIIPIQTYLWKQYVYEKFIEQMSSEDTLD